MYCILKGVGGFELMQILGLLGLLATAAFVNFQFYLDWSYTYYGCRRNYIKKSRDYLGKYLFWAIFSSLPDSFLFSNAHSLSDIMKVVFFKVSHYTKKMYKYILQKTWSFQSNTKQMNQVLWSHGSPSHLSF